MAKEHLTKLHSLNLSPSALNSFIYNKEQWFDTYILGNFKKSKEMDFGSAVDLRIQNDPTFLPHLPRYECMQAELVAMLGKIRIKGKPDGFNLTKSKELFDYKTGRNPWTQKKVEDSIQLKFYLLLLYIHYKIKPEEFVCGIHWLETKETGDFKVEFVKEENIQTFTTRYTLQDLLVFIKQIKGIYKEMERYCKLSTAPSKNPL
jgi:hypothetical protein